MVNKSSKILLETFELEMRKMNLNERLARCLSEAQTELNKIPYNDEYLKLELTFTHYEYVNGEFIRVSEGDRGHIYRDKVADTEEEI